MQVLSKFYDRAFFRHIGPNTDIPAGDIGVGLEGNWLYVWAI